MYSNFLFPGRYQPTSNGHTYQDDRHVQVNNWQNNLPCNRQCGGLVRYERYDRDYRDPRNQRDPKDPMDYRSPRDQRDFRDHRDSVDHRNPMDHRDPRNHKNPRDLRDDTMFWP